MLWCGVVCCALVSAEDSTAVLADALLLFGVVWCGVVFCAVLPDSKSLL